MQRLFGLFTKEKDPSTEWPVCQPMPLSLDLRSESLNHVAIGDPYEKLRLFGKPSNPNPHKANEFIYYPLGLTVEGDHGKVEYFLFVMHDEYEQKHESCEVTMTDERGTQTMLSSATNLADIERMWGSPQKQQADEDEIFSWYKRGQLLIEFECSPRGQLRRFHVER